VIQRDIENFVLHFQTIVSTVGGGNLKTTVIPIV